MKTLADVRTIVTGGAGFIGSHLVEALLEKGAKVTVFDNFSTGRTENLQHLLGNSSLKVVKGDILDKPALMKEAKETEAEVIFHQAAQLEIFRAIDDPAFDLKVNALGTLNVLESARLNDVKKLVYASSAGVYGQARYTPEYEGHPLRGQWPYGVSKLCGEKYCTAYFELYGLKTTSLRYSIVYGPREWYGRVLTRFVKRILEGKPPIVFGDGLQTRDFVHVRDVVDANLKAATIEQADGEVFNVGSGVGISINDLARLVIMLAGKEGRVKPVYANPKAGEMGRKPGELIHLVLDIRKAEKVLGYRPNVNIEDGVREYIEWARNNKDTWWQEERI